MMHSPTGQPLTRMRWPPPSLAYRALDHFLPPTVLPPSMMDTLPGWRRLLHSDRDFAVVHMKRDYARR